MAGYPEQRVSLPAALMGYTREAAMQASATTEWDDRAGYLVTSP